MTKSKPQSYTDRTLAIRDLVTTENVRQSLSRDQIDAMKSSILSNGLLQNLIAAPRSSDAAYAVIAGHTRHAAVAELIAEGKLPADFKVAVRIFDAIDADSTDALAIALTENIVREQMDYVDECIAMARLAQGRKSEEEIAAIFGYRPKTVTERLLIANLIPAAHDLLRSRQRNLSWARALTIADATMQKRICDDIAATPGSWESGEDIRRHLLQSTIPTGYALFDMADYTGEIVRDMFEGDQIGDIQAFWNLQNAAVTDLVHELEAEGWSQVVVSREPYQSWNYEDCADQSQAMAIVEVLPSGKVSIIRGVRLMTQEDVSITSLDINEVEASRDAEEIADFEVRATPTLSEYAAAQRTAMVQATVAGSFRKALEYTTLAMLGHRGASFSAHPYHMPGQAEMHRGKAFQDMAEVADDITSASSVLVASPDLRDGALAALVQSLPDIELHRLFSGLISQRLGQQNRRGADAKEDSLMNVFGQGIDIRSWWTPNETFFSLMATEDLRRLATNLLPGNSSTRFAASRKKDLVRALSDNFAEARDGLLPNREVQDRLNSWVPGIMSFPAKIAMRAVQTESAAGEEDIDALLFDA